MCKLRKELPPVHLAAVTCDSWSGMTGKLVPGSIIVCSMGSSTARGVKITGVCRSLPLPDGVGRRRLAALSGLPDSAARRQIFFGSYCIQKVIRMYFLHYGKLLISWTTVTLLWDLMDLTAHFIHIVLGCFTDTRPPLLTWINLNPNMDD